VIRHIDAVELATIYDDVSIVAATTVLDYHYTTITAAATCHLPSSLYITFYTSFMM